MLDRKTLSLLFKGISLLGTVAYLVTMTQLNELPVDSGDGISHFSISQESWTDSAYFLDHWGKPLFTLLSSPFAQLGFNWYIGFNILVFALTVLVVFRLFRHLELGVGYYFLFPPLLLVIPDYVSGVLGGMTEPLFGLLIVLLLYCGFRRQWYWFAVIASFTLFSRSEGMLVIILALPVLVLNRQWKAIPLLATGFLIYAVAGWYKLDSFWWYFERDPYLHVPPMAYGSGTWGHFLEYRTAHTGILTLILLPAGLLGMWIFLKKSTIPRVRYIVLFGFGVYFGILFVHSYFWAYGLHGSIGLTRVITLGIPGLLTLVLIGCNSISRELHILPNAAVFLVLLFGIGKEMSELSYPLHPNGLEEVVINATVYADKTFPDAKIVYYHPLVAWKMGYTIKNVNTRIQQRYFDKNENNVRDLPNGTIIIRDPAFGPTEQGLPLEMIQGIPEMVEVRRFTTNKPYSIYNGEEVIVRVYKIVKQ